MDLVQPESWIVSPQWVIGFVISLALAVWTARAAYSQIMSKLEVLRQDIEGMKARNLVADHENEVVKEEQSRQRTVMAVIDERQRTQSLTLERIESVLNRMAEKMEKRL